LDLPRAAGGQVIRYIAKSARHEWGPVLPSHLLPEGGLPPAVYAALQWLECVQGADALLDMLPPGRSCSVRYEEFVADAAIGLASIISTLNFEVDPASITAAVGPVCGRVGSDHGILDAAATALLRDRATSTLQRHGYSLDDEY
jgi:hypothetical protein